jgi:type IV pilus assembly protein PilA
MGQDQRGFTLIEMLVVIVIIGVLSKMAIPSYTRAVDRAEVGACKANRRILSTAAATYYMDHSTYYKLDSAGNPTDEVIGIANLVEYVENAKALTCPAGGNYTIVLTASNGKASSAVIRCDHDGHGDFGVFGTTE